MHKEKDELKKPYEAPRLTAVSFLTERGFAVSGELLLWENVPGRNNMENYKTQEGWGRDGNFF